MRVVLRSDVQGVGLRGDILDVSDGYGRNYLIPRQLAFLASEGVEAQATAMRKARDLRDAKNREAAESVARSLVTHVIELRARASGGGNKLFGSVGPTEIAHAIQEQAGVEVDKKDIHLEEPIKSLGEHAVNVQLHSSVQFQVQLNVVKA